jgi:CheY-like chemotaxis protein
LKTVCIIDDDKIHHFTIRRTIELQGIKKEMLFFNDGVEAIEFFNDNLSNSSALPDIIFLDLNMPVINGWQFLQRYAMVKDRIQKEIKIYVVSSSVNPLEISRATAMEDVSGYFEKPITPEAIRQVFEAGNNLN